MKLIIPFFIVSFLLVSCKKDCREKGNCSPEYYKYELGEAKNYLWANVGSYWIYKNTKTGELDTQTCTSCTSYFITAKGSYKETQHITVEYEKLIKSTYSSFNKWTYNDISAKYNPDALRSYRTGIDRNVNGSVNVPFIYPFVFGDFSGTGSSYTYCINSDTSITIQGTQYDNIAIFEIDMDGIWETKNACIRPNTRYYWAKNIGLVKKEMRSCNYSWELIDYRLLP